MENKSKGKAVERIYALLDERSFVEIGQAQRIIDFIGGASFAVDGSLKAISNNIFIVAPGNIEVSGDLRDEIVSEDMLSPELTKF